VSKAAATRHGARVLMLTLGLSLLAAPADPADDSRRPGAYCPFPEDLKKGEVPTCFTPAQQQYPEFLEAVESGRIDDPGVARLEQQLEAADSGESDYLALASLAYGYFRLAERAAHSERPNPALVARLNSWNHLLSGLYENTATPPELRTAVRDAARDLHERAPAVDTSCPPGADGDSCQTTGLLLQTLRRIDDPAGTYGVRGALGKLLDRVRGGDDAPSTRAVGDQAE
jgi:hypothetical protein